jgi:hypothetical protein
MTVQGSLAMSSGSIEIELGGLVRGTGYDALAVTGNMELAGTLEVLLIDLGEGVFSPQEGDSFDILDWGGDLTTTFDHVYLPALAGDLVWDTGALYTEGRLSVMAGLIGDANGDGVVDAADYIALKTHMGQGSGATKADGNFDFDGDVDWHDLQLLRAHYGDTIPASSAITPEPVTLSLLGLGGLMVLRRQRAR